MMLKVNKLSPTAPLEMPGKKAAEQALYSAVLEVITKAQNDALGLGWDSFKGFHHEDTALNSMTLEQAREKFQYRDMGQGDRMVHWKPTGEAIMFIQAPKVDMADPLKPKGSVGYKLPTWAERQELARLRAR